MILLRLSSVGAHPREIFKALADLQADIDWARNDNTPIPIAERIKHLRQTGIDYMNKHHNFEDFKRELKKKWAKK